MLGDSIRIRLIDIYAKYGILIKEKEEIKKAEKYVINEAASQLKVLNSLGRNFMCKSREPVIVAIFVKEILNIQNVNGLSGEMVYEYMCRSEKIGIRTLNAWNATEKKIYPRL